ncbi:MAG: threonine--tRNA ligase [Candidatus Kerfeldbacteria bacterium]|nr:threonine--tRNA ligase [Candidatus Kerfeldbacteria bacterium]
MEKPMHQFHELRHSLAHVLAAAVLRIFPEAKLGIGPVIESGFYYDFDLPRPLIPQDLLKIEKEMRKLISQSLGFERQELSVADAKKLFAGQPFKLELIQDLATKGTTVFDELENAPAGKPAATITAYTTGKFVDLCRGGHLESTKQIKADAFKLTRTAGAYWRGDEKNPMLQRIYGVAFPTKAELDAYLTLQEEMKKRDHRKLGNDLELFDFHDVSPGAAFWLPQGMIIYRLLEDLIRSELQRDAYVEIKTPQIIHQKLWQESGHWDHYQDNMFLMDVEKQTYSLKPMNCPGSTFVYRRHKRSYRELPVRLAEFGLNSRNELSGALGGLFRVRQFTMDDAHIYARPDQIQAEVKQCLAMMKRVYKYFGFQPKFYLSTMPDQHLGTEATWRAAEKELASALKSQKIPFELKEKDGAFYGPKVDININDALGRSWQLTTIQLDYNVPERFNLSYTDEHGNDVRPVIIHRAILGSMERFVGILIEHFAGAFPVWLAPVQVAILTVGKAHIRYAKKLHQLFIAAGIRSKLIDANETVGYKIRNAEKQKVPYMLVIGDKEMNSSKLAVRLRGKKTLLAISQTAFIKRVQQEIEKRK